MAITMTPFWLPLDPEPEVVYYPPQIPIVNTKGDPVLDGLGMPTYQAQPTINCAEQATVNTCFKRAQNYYGLYMHIRRAVFNCLDDRNNDAFKVSNDPVLVGWNPSMEPREIYDQIMTTNKTVPIETNV
jgi:hypothetical protein